MHPKSLSWSPLHHQLRRWIQTEGLVPGAYGVAVSGGQDSSLLLQLLYEVSGVVGFKLDVLHIHHGGGGFRDEALEFTRTRAKDLGLDFFSQRSEIDLRAEEEAREFRLRALREIQSQRSLRGVFFGHHQDDLLETRMLRLIRGVGPQGLPAMIEQSDFGLRPFLRMSRAELSALREERQLPYIEDPTNAELEFERNWLRRVWLPMLEEQRPGSLRSLSRSLELLAEAFGHVNWQWPEDLFVNSTTLSRPVYQSQDRFRQRQCLATLLRNLGQRDYSQGQIEEIQKYLDKSQSEHSFQIAGRLWRVGLRHIEAIEVEVRSK